MPFLDSSMVELPDVPEPIELELEFTNACNADCTECPRSDMPRTGFMEPGTLDQILEAYEPIRASHHLNHLDRRLHFPRVTVAGGGEPLLHRQSLSMLRRIVTQGYKVHLITNASRIQEEQAVPLIETGISSIAVSFWGIAREEYESAMRLPYEQTLRRVENLASVANSLGVPLTITWVAARAIRSSPEQIRAFWQARGIEIETGDNEPWNRGGLLQLGSVTANAESPSRLPDLRRRIWCADLYFTDAYSWQGNCVLCCCNYFTSRPLILGNISTHSPIQIADLKARILSGRPIPNMCTVCEQPRRAQSSWLAGPWLPWLDERERAMVTYDPRWRLE